MKPAEPPDPELKHLQAELARYRRLESLYDETEQLALLGHYEWDYGKDRLRSCSSQYARIFGASVDELLTLQNGWEQILAWVHPDDHDL